MDDDKARQRLLVYTLVRFGGVAIFFFGVATIYSDVLRRGGWPRLGAVIAIVGAIDALLAPHFLKRAWDRKDQESQ